MTETLHLKNWTVETFLAISLLHKIRTTEPEIGKKYDLTGAIETLRILSHDLLEANGISEDEALRWYREAMASPAAQQIVDLTN